MTGTLWEAGRLDGRSGPARVLFGRVHEDSAIEAGLFPPGTRIACIASAGDTAIDLAGVRTVTAVDINPAQLAYARRRSSGAPAEAGVAERWVSVGRKMLQLAGWRRGSLEAFLGMDDPAAQTAYWRRHLDTARFRLLVDNLLRPTLLRTVYAAPLLRVVPAPFGPVLRRRMARCWARHPNRTNPHARALLLGDAGAPAGRPGSAITFAAGDMAEFLESCPASSFDGFSFSNILDGAAPAYGERLLAAARHAGVRGARAVMRSFAEPAAGPGVNLAAEDRSFIWGVVSVVNLP